MELLVLIVSVGSVCYVAGVFTSHILLSELHKAVAEARKVVADVEAKGKAVEKAL